MPDSNNQSESKNEYKKVFTTGAAIIAVGAILYSLKFWGIITIKVDLISTWNDVMTKYIFIIVAIERAAAVWIGIKRNKMQDTWKSRVARLDELFTTSETHKEGMIANLRQAELASLYSQESSIIDKLDPPPNGKLIQPAEEGSNADEDDNTTKVYKSKARGYLRQVRLIYTYRYEQYLRETNNKIAQTVFISGLVLSAIGLSFLNDILDIKSLNSSGLLYQVQLGAYRIADIFITGGLIGGGSVGLTKLFDTINSFMSIRKV